MLGAAVQLVWNLEFIWRKLWIIQGSVNIILRIILFIHILLLLFSR